MPFVLPIISDVTFNHETIAIDGKRYENCKFIDCEIVYSGGLSEISACEFSPNTVWNFQGAAATILQVLQGFGWHFVFGSGEVPPPLYPV